VQRAQRRKARADAAHVQKLLHRQQFPPKDQCASAPLLVYVLSGAKGGVGLGCEFHGLALALATALQRNRTLVLATSRWWLAGRGGSGVEDARGVEGGWVRGGSGKLEWVCGGHGGGGAGASASGFECFFEAVSSCSVKDSRDLVEFTPGSDPFSESERFWVPPAFRCPVPCPVTTSCACAMMCPRSSGVHARCNALARMHVRQGSWAQFNTWHRALTHYG
jgi:hypothetical protein